jgi:hypothetical protein
MMRAAALFCAAVAFLAPRAPCFAQAARPCPSSTIGEAFQYAGPITAVLYDSQSQLLYVIWQYVIVQVFSNVPASFIQTFANGAANPVPIYNSIISSYPSLLLMEKSGCPILTEGGNYISTNGISTVSGVVQ